MVLTLVFFGLMAAVFSVDNKVVSASSSTTLQPGPEGKDSFVFAMNGNQNYGSQTNLSAGGGTSSPPASRTYLQFDLSSIPPNTTLESANISLYYYGWYGPSDLSADLPIQKVTSAWDESTITYNNQPSFDASPVANLSVGNSGNYGWQTVNLTTLVQSWLNGSVSNNGLMINYANPPVNNAKDFYSSDYIADPSLRPKLVLTYSQTESPPTTPPSTTPPPAAPPGTGTTGNNNPPSGTTTVTPPAETPSGTNTTVPEQTAVHKSALTVSADSSTSATKGVAQELDDRNLTVIPLAIAGAASAVATAVVFVESLATGFSIKEIFIIIANFFFSLFSFRKRDKFGEVYDQTTNRPVQGAIVLIFAIPEVKLVAVKTTNAQGHFFFPVNPGRYALSVKRRGFIFPSHFAKGKDVYLGQTLEVTEKKIINIRIPLDPTPQMQSKPSLIRAIFFSTYVRFAVLISGTVLSAYILYYERGLKSYLILFSYLILWSIEYLIQNRILKFSRVIDKENKNPVDLAIVRIIGRDGRIRQTFVSDENGYVIPYADDRWDKITIERIGYQRFEDGVGAKGFVEQKTFPLTKKAE